jgi:preprotein translocase subunit SecE
MANLNPAKFIREVRQEMGKVSWPTRKETMVSTLMVLAMVIATSTFFVLADLAIGTAIHAIIGI